MKLITKYSIAFLLVAWGLMGLLFLSYNFITDRESFSKILADLSAFGSFLSGLGTIIASIAAAVGVNNWISQLKTGKYLSIIWDAQTSLRKYYSYETDLYIHKYQYRFYSNKNDPIALEVFKRIQELELQLSAQTKTIQDNIHDIDQLIEKGSFIWSMTSSALETAWFDIKNYLENSNYPQTPIDLLKESSVLTLLNDSFSQQYEKLCDELLKLESKYTSI